MIVIEDYKTKLTKENYIVLKDFFKYCPKDILNDVIEVNFKKNMILLKAKEKIQHIYIILRGSVDAIEEQAKELPYSFATMVPIEIVGDYEVISQQQHAVVSLQATKDCLCLSIPANTYIEWLQKDANASYMRMRMLVLTLSYQTQIQRSYLSLNSQERFIHFLCDEYDKQLNPNRFTLPFTREYIASYIGCSVRTLNRVILELESDGLISRKGGKINISKEHYKVLNERRE